MVWNVLRGQQGKRWLSSNHFQEFIAFFQIKMSQIDTEIDKQLKIFQFSK